MMQSESVLEKKKELFDNEDGVLEREAAKFTESLHQPMRPLGRSTSRHYWHEFSEQYEKIFANSAPPKDDDGSKSGQLSGDPKVQLLQEHRRALEGAFNEIGAARDTLATLPQITLDSSVPEPRIFLVIEKFLDITDDRWTRETWSTFVSGIELDEALLIRELWGTVSGLKFVLMRRIAHYANFSAQEQDATKDIPLQMQRCFNSLEALGQVSWPRFLEPLVAFDPILRRDPAGAYPKMERASRLVYHDKIAKLAARSDMSEVQVANAAIQLAEEAAQAEGAHVREAHVGYYLLDDGVGRLANRVGHHPKLLERLRSTIKSSADDFYIGGIEIVTSILIFVILAPHISVKTSVVADIFAVLIMVIPASQSVVDLFNNLVSRIFSPTALPKLDFSDGVPAQFTTLVAVPTLLLNEGQVKKLVEDLEIRYLANQDPNIHFALLTDLADSIVRPAPNDGSPLLDLALALIADLNDRYSAGRKGTIFLLHRHRIFNQREKVWMGWERKRGKLLDLNKLLCGESDPFPVKSATLPDITKIRYVITLDSDTQLPRGAAHRLIGTMAHPLNQPVVDARSQIVTKGYGILQPRVDISVHSANHSRLAALQSGETGMDPYSRAVSDVYQDLYGEAIFTGKGLYDVSVLHAVLNKRFPRNSLLSHDLIEGAYVRVGLVSDVEVVDDYPSHYSSWSRRRHRWVRGDWQTVQWLLNRVPNEQGKYVKNPISITSRWKILDNLRRSLVEIATLALLLSGWFGLPGGALYWTFATLALLFLPVYVQLSFSLLPAIYKWNARHIKQALWDSVDSHGLVLLSLVFLPSQVLITLDAIIRATFRRFVSGDRLLEWETAAEAELNTGGTPVDRYLRSLPVLTLVLAEVLYWRSPRTLLIALPILLLWSLTMQFVRWLNAKPVDEKFVPGKNETIFLRTVALRTWNYFAKFSNEEHHWLIPDNVQEEDKREADRVSPTNVGLLLNARQAALEFGYITLAEFTRLTALTLEAVERMPKYRGHLCNWHSSKTLEIVPPLMVTTVDSGNLAASFISLRMGCLERLERPMIGKELLHGLRDYLQVLESLGVSWPARMINLKDEGKDQEWLDNLLHLSASVHLAMEEHSDSESRRWAQEMENRLRCIRDYVTDYLPWHLPEFEALRGTVLAELSDEMCNVTPLRAQRLLDEMIRRLDLAVTTRNDVSTELCANLREKISAATPRIAKLTSQLQQICEHVRFLLRDMDFTFLLNPDRELLSIGYLLDENELEPSCFDLIASEARIAVFVAVAKGDIAQQVWFRLGRTYIKAAKKIILLSWTGTMFEYLMPTLFMQTYPNTMMYRTLADVVEVQRWFAKRLRIPWGISESGYSDTDAAGNYLYHAFGIPDVALKHGADAGPIVSPYSTCLALGIDPEAAVSNLYRMQKLGWLGEYGFYEAADFRSVVTRRRGEGVIVRSWMVHHQGMSLVAICNLLQGRAFQRWFHDSPMVQSTERLLHERPQIPEFI